MSLVEQINQDLKDAMRAKDKVRLNTVRAIRAGVINALKEDGAEELADDRVLAILRKLSKQRKDAMDAYQTAGRDDLYENEAAERAIIETYLPSLADAATTRGWVEAAIAETGADGPKGMGKVLGSIMRSHKGEVDGNLARQIAQELLAG